MNDIEKKSTSSVLEAIRRSYSKRERVNKNDRSIEKKELNPINPPPPANGQWVKKCNTVFDDIVPSILQGMDQKSR